MGGVLDFYLYFFFLLFNKILETFWLFIHNIFLIFNIIILIIFVYIRILNSFLNFILDLYDYFFFYI